MHPGSQEGKQFSDKHLKKNSQSVKRGDYSAVFSIGIASPSIFYAVLLPTILKGCCNTGMHTAEGNKADRRAGRHFLKAAEDTGILKVGEKDVDG